jgi:putative endonuclease
MAWVYILYSERIDRYYIGSTGISVKVRLERHNTGYYENSFSRRGRPWELFLEVSCVTRDQALLIESHIKRMKSRKYIENLKRYPEILEKLQSQDPPR